MSHEDVLQLLLEKVQQHKPETNKRNERLKGNSILSCGHLGNFMHLVPTRQEQKEILQSG